MSQSGDLILNWEKLSQLTERPKLRDVAGNPRHLFDDFYQIGDSEYLSASKQWDHGFTEETLYVNRLYWAASLKAFHRLVKRKRAVIDEDDGAIQPLPSRLRLAPNCTTYKQIITFTFECPELYRTHEMEESDENWKPAGLYVSVNAWSYFFRSSKPVPSDEMPYGLDLVMNKRHLTPLVGLPRDRRPGFASP